MDINYRKFIKSYKDFPKKDIVFWDFTYLLDNVEARNSAIEDMKRALKDKKFDKIVAIESKGFTIGSIVAHELNKSLVLIRKPNLIPGEFYSETFVKEYGIGEYQIKPDLINENDKVVIIYDIMAGSGATKGAINLIEKCGGKIVSLIYVTELKYLGGREDLKDYDIFSLVKIDNKPKC